MNVSILFSLFIFLSFSLFESRREVYIILLFLQFNFVGRILGPRGNSLKRVEASTGCRVFIRGKGSIKDPEKVIEFSRIKVVFYLSGQPKSAKSQSYLFNEKLYLYQSSLVWLAQYQTIINWEFIEARPIKGNEKELLQNYILRFNNIPDKHSFRTVIRWNKLRSCYIFHHKYKIAL